MQKVLVVGATGHVGSQVVAGLREAGHTVRAMVRQEKRHVPGASEHVVADLSDPASLGRAVEGMTAVVASANAIIPNGRTLSVGEMADQGYRDLIRAAEAAGVGHFVLASVPSHPMEKLVPELAGKRRIEAMLEASQMAVTVVRNPAFTDVWMVMAGAGLAASNDDFATSKRPYAFMKLWQRLTGRLADRWGIILAPGGGSHGAPFVTTRDVAAMLVGAVARPANGYRVIEAGGPEWLTWQQVAEAISVHAGRKVRAVPVPAGIARLGQLIARPFAPSAANVFGLLNFVATYQPRWEAPPVVDEFSLPPQTTLKAFLEENWGKE